MSLVTVVCPTDCENYLAPVDFSLCDPDVDFGEIERIYVTARGAGLTDWTDAAEWAARLDNDTEDDNTKIRTLFVRGDQPPAESNEVEISLCRIVYSEKDFTLNLDIDETSVINNDFMRYIECNDLYTIWYQAGKYLYGGTDGIDVNIGLNNNIPRGCNELNLITGTVKWQAKHSPEKIINPL